MLLHYFIILLWFSKQMVESNDIHVEKSGIFPVEKDDIGIRFYLTVANNGKQPIKVVKAHEPECCWTVEEDDEDCESMKLYGGFPVEIDVGTKKNVTYVFPNLYPLDRIGSCKLHLKNIKERAIVHEIQFDTTPEEDSSADLYRRCRGVDENLRNSCYPYMCAKRYNGFRNYYRTEFAKCEPVHHCKTKLGDDNIPESAFDFDYNRCKSLVKDELKEEERKAADIILDESPLAKLKTKYEDINPQDLRIDCKHGKQVGRYCRCNKGWQTVSVLTQGGGVRMEWCSKKVAIKQPEKPNRYLKMSLLTFLVMSCMCLMFLVGYLWWRLFLKEIVGEIIASFKSLRKDDSKEAKDVQFPDMVWNLGGEQFNSESADMRRNSSSSNTTNELTGEEIFLTGDDGVDDDSSSASDVEGSVSDVSQDSDGSDVEEYKDPYEFDDEVEEDRNSSSSSDRGQIDLSIGSLNANDANEDGEESGGSSSSADTVIYYG